MLPGVLSRPWDSGPQTLFLPLFWGPRHIPPTQYLGAPYHIEYSSTDRMTENVKNREHGTNGPYVGINKLGP